MEHDGDSHEEPADDELQVSEDSDAQESADGELQQDDDALEEETEDSEEYVIDSTNADGVRLNSDKND